jgi:hypothetical protein
MGRILGRIAGPAGGLGLALALLAGTGEHPARAQPYRARGPERVGAATGDALPTVAEAFGREDPRRPSARKPVLYPVTPQAGPWMICAASYVGPDAHELSRQVILELRNRHGLKAWVYNYGAEERRKQDEHWERIQKQYPGVKLPRKMVRIPDQCAVLIGGYESMESASKDLARVRALPLPRLDLGPDKTPYDMMSVAEPDPKNKVMRVKQAPINPFETAFVTHNPTVPVEVPEQPKFDPFWKTLNKNEEYSLLRCKKPWTLVVKDYQGLQVIQPQQGPKNLLEKLGLTKQKPGVGLGAAAAQAHQLAKFLRHPSLGFEAYVLHTRTKSIVTVGGFDGLNDPEMVRVQRNLARVKLSDASRHDPIGMYKRPMPMEVPRY